EPPLHSRKYPLAVISYTARSGKPLAIETTHYFSGCRPALQLTAGKRARAKTKRLIAEAPPIPEKRLMLQCIEY
ncbi:BgTH12-07693, partial [Blumeria graminis f. sp. triticale]